MEPPALLTAEEWTLLNTQRSITAALNKDVVKVGATYLRPSSKIPVSDDWFKSNYLDTNLQDWTDLEDRRYYNVGFNLQQGWVDVDVDGDDAEYNRCIYAAMRHVGVDCRLAFGRLSAGVPRHFLVQLPEEEAGKSFKEFKRFEPRAVRINNQRFFTEIRSNVDDRENAKQTVVPGSIYGDANRLDVSVWWDEQGRVARSVNQIAKTSPRIVNFTMLIRGIAFGTILYIAKPHWIEGSRQSTALRFNGWLARVVDESIAMNTNEQLCKEVFCPIDSDQIAESLIEFVCRMTGDEEAYMRKRVYHDAREKLSRNPDAKIPGWPSIGDLFGEEAKIALRGICIPGTDTSPLMKLVERYVYNQSDGRYLDRERFATSLGKFSHAAEDLYRRHKADTILIKNKPHEAFKSFEMSKLRIEVGDADLYPDKAAGQIFRLSRSRGYVPDEFDGGDSHLVFNTWRGWDFRPTPSVNDGLMAECVRKLDTVLAWLTCDRAEQIQWVKEWLAWTFQHPGDKQQIAWAVIGGQGVGKSFIGNVFCNAVFGSLHGMVNGKIIGEKFSVAPFIGKMFVFADEVRFKSGPAIEEIKLLIRNTKTHGELKGIDARDYNIFARLMFASNNVNVRIGDENVVDRALFFTKAYTPEFMNVNQIEFNEWTMQHKPFFDEFSEFLKRPDVKSHYMHYFMTLPANRHQIESIRWSSSRDADIVLHNISGPRRIAKMIVESGRLFSDLDISHPFTKEEFFTQVGELCKNMNENVRGSWVWDEFEKLGMIEQVRVKTGFRYRFKWQIGTLTEKFGEAIGILLTPQYDFGPGDFGPNTNDGSKPIRWKGQKVERFGKF